MKRKIIAVINDQTGTVHAALEGYQSSLPFSGMPSKYIEDAGAYGEIGEYFWIKLDYFGFEHVVSTENYSAVWEEVAE